MSTPTPAPRTLIENKKPIPAPRLTIPIHEGKTKELNIVIDKSDKKSDVNTNTFTRRVRTLSNASKQIAEDIGGKVQESKKAAIESTRQSLRKITKRFTNNFNEQEISTPTKPIDDACSDTSSDITLFNSIQFKSPIHLKNAESIYSNIHNEDIIEDEMDQPPPPYPPPPLREEVYDKPQSLASGSTNSSEERPVIKNPLNYESVFPSYPYNSDTESCEDMTAGTIERNINVSRSESWNFYDALPKVEPRSESIYSNIDNTPALQASKDNADNHPSYVRSNSLYENHNLVANNRTANSILLQFDPLSKTNNNVTEEPKLQNLSDLELLLQGDLYNNCSMDSISIPEDISDGDDTYISPPTPPPRFDSLQDIIDNEDLGGSSSIPTTPQSEKKKTSWFVLPEPSTSKQTENSKAKSSPKPDKYNKWLKQVNDVLKKAPDLVKSKTKTNFLQRPALMPKGIIQQKGMLFKITNGPVEDLFGEFSARWCILQGATMVCHSDNTCENIKEQFTMDSVLSIQILQDQKFKYRTENEELHCFELNIAGKSRGGHIYGSKSISERRVWVQKLAESLTCRFGPKITSDFKRLGWAYMREGVSGEWKGAWLVLTQRTLRYAVDDCSLKSLDLRKARCFSLQPVLDFTKTPCTTDKGPNMVIDFTSGTIYFRMWTQRETKVWCHIIKLSAQNNGANLDQQQMTKNDVPVIVEKCINFIYAHGSMSEGIYRRAGRTTVVSDILSQFRHDAWSVQLTDKYTDHDVATALKRFFRDLAEPLLDNNKRQYLYQVSLVENKEARIRMYKAVFDQVAPVTYNTTRRLLGHLHFIGSQSHKNKMNIENLSAVWGPTLLHHDENEDFIKDHAIISQLITLYRHIFPEDPKEAEQERVMLAVLEKYNKSPQGMSVIKASGDFRVWVYLYNKEGTTFNVLIGPQRTVYDVLCELSPKVKLPVQEIILEELVLNDNLTRPIHHTEKVLDVVLRWGYWDDADRKDNCLVLGNISKHWEILGDSKGLPLSGELKYADNKTKNFKLFTFDFIQAKLTQFKDKTATVVANSWNIEDIIWYFGNESKRNPNSKYTVTFIEKKLKPTRSKSAPWFGNIMVWPDPAGRATWVMSMLRAEYHNNLTPPPQHVNLMSS